MVQSSNIDSNFKSRNINAIYHIDEANNLYQIFAEVNSKMNIPNIIPMPFFISICFIFCI